MRFKSSLLLSLFESIEETDSSSVSGKGIVVSSILLFGDVYLPEIGFSPIHSFRLTNWGVEARIW